MGEVYTRNFSELGVGEEGVIHRFTDRHTTYRQRLMSLGLTPGTRFSVLKVAPLGDPVEIEVRGFRLSLRRREAACIEVTPP